MGLWDKIWKDKEGHAVLWQMPNRYLLAWAVFSVLSMMANGWLYDVFSWAASAALIAWCYLEIFRGVNYFRRGLGILVLVYVMMPLVKSLTILSDYLVRAGAVYK